MLHRSIGYSQGWSEWEYRCNRSRHLKVFESASITGLRVKFTTLGPSGTVFEVGRFPDNYEKDALAFQLKDCIIRD